MIRSGCSASGNHPASTGCGGREGGAVRKDRANIYMRSRCCSLRVDCRPRTCSREDRVVKLAPPPLVEGNSLPKGEQVKGKEKQGSVVSVRAGCSHCIPKVELLQLEHPKTQA